MLLQCFVTVHTTFSTVHLQCNFGEPLCPFIFFNFFSFRSSVCTYIYIYIYIYTDTINFTIFSQLLKYQFLISQNKIIKYETMTNHN